MDDDTGRHASSLEMIFAEMSRQRTDALRSFEKDEGVAASVAVSVRRTGRLRLIGMGGSHCADRTAEAVLRRNGIDAIAVTASEVLYAPFPHAPATTTLLTSQSGESAEIVRLLESSDPVETFGLTLDPSSALARAVPCMIGHGGVETAFAATRSLMISLAQLASITSALGFPQEDTRAALASEHIVSADAAVDALRGAEAVIFCARTSLNGIAEAGALGLLELARIPAFSLEGGQFRHGPVEVLRPGIGVVFLRADDDTADLIVGAARICSDAGLQPVVLDASGREPMEGCINVLLPRSVGFAAAVHILPAMQDILIGVARARVKNVGQPLRSEKVTRSE